MSKYSKISRFLNDHDSMDGVKIRCGYIICEENLDGSSILCVNVTWNDPRLYDPPKALYGDSTITTKFTNHNLFFLTKKVTSGT